MSNRLVLVIVCATAWITVESTFIKDIHILKKVRSRDEMVRHLRMKLTEKQRLLDARRIADAKLKAMLEEKQRARNELWLRQRFGNPGQITVAPSVSKTTKVGDKTTSVVSETWADTPHPNVFHVTDTPLAVHTENKENKRNLINTVRPGPTSASSSELTPTLPTLLRGSKKNKLVKDDEISQNTDGTDQSIVTSNVLLATAPASVSREQNGRNAKATDDTGSSTVSSRLSLTTMPSNASRESNTNFIEHDDRGKLTGGTDLTTASSSSEALQPMSPKVSRESSKDVAVKDERDTKVVVGIDPTTVSSKEPLLSTSQNVSRESNNNVLVQDDRNANSPDGAGPTTVSSRERIGSTSPNTSHGFSKIDKVSHENVNKLIDKTRPATTTSSKPIIPTFKGLHSTTPMNKANNIRGQDPEINTKRTVITVSTTPSTQLKQRSNSIDRNLTIGNAGTQSSNQSSNHTDEERNVSFSTAARGHIDSTTNINSESNKSATRAPMQKDIGREQTTRMSNGTTATVTTINETDDAIFENQFPIDSIWEPWFDPDFQGPLGAAILQDVTFGPDVNSTTRSPGGDTGSGTQMALPVTEEPRGQSSRNSQSVIAGFLSTLDNWFTGRKK